MPKAEAQAADWRYGFRRLTQDDMTLIGRWLNEPHVARWWPDATRQLTEIAKHLDDPGIDPYIVSVGDQPIGYLQSYDTHAAWDHPYSDQPAGTRGLDQFIGEPAMIGRGHGPRFMAAFCAALFDTGVPRVITDPDPANAAAVRAYEKAGFVTLGTRTINDGPVVLMAKDRAN